MIKHKETYNEARSAFDGLRIEEQALFLVESAVSMLANGIEQLGAMMARQFEDEADDHAGEGTSAAEEGTKKRTTKSAKTNASKKPRSSASGTSPRASRAPKPDSDAAA